MKNIILGTILIFSFAAFGKVTKQIQAVNFYVKTPYQTPPSDQIYLTGSVRALCNWRPDCLKLTPVAPGLWKGTLILVDESRSIQFKVTRGSWKTEACTQTGDVLDNFEVSLNRGDADYTMTIENWCDQKSFQSPHNVVWLENFYLEELNRYRNILVYLPSSYDESNPQKRFPVVYMHDGQNVLNPETSAFGREWGVDETIEEMIKRKQSEGFIVVAIPCHCLKRNSEYNYFEEGDLYAKSIVNNLKPYIDQTFHTVSSREGTFTMGSSMGALISFSIVWEYPGIFKGGAGLSFPAFAYENFIFDVAKKFSVYQDTFFYFDHGGRGQDATYDQSMREFILLLESLGVKDNQYVYQKFSFAGHNEVDWSHRVYVPLSYFEMID